MQHATAQRYSTRDVNVEGGVLRVGIWDAEGVDNPPTVLAIHGVTASHMCWVSLAEAMPGVRILAVDLRGRGQSNELPGPTGMRVHANDMVTVLDAFGLEAVPVIGHSMGAFVAVVMAHLHPSRVSQLVLIDGGLPLEVPEGIEPDALIAAILGPVAERLSKRWTSVEQYTEAFWRQHPAFVDDWSDELELYIAYDLVPDGDEFRSATSYSTMSDDTIDLTTGTDLPAAVAGLQHPTLFITVPRGLMNEEPGLYPAARLERLADDHPGVRHVALKDLNHYTVLLSKRGARELAPLIAQECGLT